MKIVPVPAVNDEPWLAGSILVEAQRLGEGMRVRRRDEPRSPLFGDLREAADRAQHQGAAECQRCVEDSGLLDVPVRQNDEVRSPHERWDLRVGHDPVHEAHGAGRGAREPFDHAVDTRTCERHPNIDSSCGVAFVEEIQVVTEASTCGRNHDGRVARGKGKTKT